MKKSTLAILAGSHALVILLGVVLAKQWSSGSGTRIPSIRHRSDPAADAGPSGRQPRNEPGKFQAARRWHGSEYARAWKAVRTARLTTAERLRIQRELLKEWAQTDLVAAMEAALAEAWDGDGTGYYDPTGPLLDVFADALAKDPQAGWDMIRGKQFGVGTGMVRHVWINAVGKKDPLFLAARIGELSWRDRDKALAACKSGISNVPGGPRSLDLLKVLVTQPEDAVTADQLLGFFTIVDGTDQEFNAKQDLFELADGDGRMEKVAAMLLGRDLASKSPDEIREAIQNLSSENREAALWAALKESDPGAKNLGILNLLAEENAWAKLDQSVTVNHVRAIAQNEGARQVADWAAGLPVRPETTELFHRSVDTYIRENMEGARDWIASIPAEWRDRAYAEYSQQAVNSHNDPNASQWAMDQIGDPQYRAVVKGWRKDWERRTGWQPD